MFCLKKKTTHTQLKQQQQRSHLTANGSRMEKHLNSKKKRKQNKQTKTNTFKILPHYLKDVDQEI